MKLAREDSSLGIALHPNTCRRKTVVSPFVPKMTKCLELLKWHCQTKRAWAVQGGCSTTPQLHCVINQWLFKRDLS